MSAYEEIYGKVARVLAESLNVDEGDLTPTATLQGDLWGRACFWAWRTRSWSETGLTSG